MNKILVTLLLLLNLSYLNAQNCPCDPDDNACIAAHPECTTSIPIDQNLIWLIMGGIILGFTVTQKAGAEKSLPKQ